MMKSKLQIAGMLLLMSVTLNAVAANVEWNRMKLVDAEVWDSGPIWDIWGCSELNAGLCFGFFVTISFFDDPWAWCGSNLMVGTSTVWVRQMSAGDVVSRETMQAPGLDYFYQAEIGGHEVRSDYNIPMDSGNAVYLAVSALAWENNGAGPDCYLAYGWVALALDSDSEPTVLASAWDVDGGAMYVGGGAVPEPTGAMLALVGMAVLASRRKRWLRGDFELEVTK